MSTELDNVENAISQASDTDALDFYKSLTPDNRELERDIIARTLECLVIPESVRYGIFKGVHRGVVRSTDGGWHYFNYPPNGNFHLVKADTPTKEWEAKRLTGKCDLGFDLIKAHKSVEHAVDDDDEDEKKAAPGGTATLPPASRPEDREIATQNSQITTVHPGAAGGTTPEDDDSAEKWHGTGHLERALPEITQETNAQAWDTNQLMKAWGQQLQATAPRISNIDPKQRQFMIEVMGKTPGEIDSGKTKMSPTHHAQYNQWLTKSLRGRIDSLSSLLRKAK